MCQTYKAVEVVRNYSNGSKEIITEVTCKRCSGNGVFQQYRNINDGLCYECNGTGVTEKGIKVNKDDKIEITQRNNKIKKVKSVNDDEALRNAMVRINKERKEERKALKNLLEEDRKLIEEMNNCTDRFTWDD
jgi:hypothetical protein